MGNGRVGTRESEVESLRIGIGAKKDEKKGEPARKETHCVTLLADKLFGRPFDGVRATERT